MSIKFSEFSSAADLDYLVGLTSGANIKINKADLKTALAPTVGAATQIPFVNGTADGFSYSSNLVWDSGKLGIGTNAPTNTLHVTGGAARLLNIYIGLAGNTAISNTNGDTTINVNNGVGIAGGSIITPTARLHVRGSGTTSATTAFLVQDSVSNDLVRVLDDGKFGIGVTPTERLHVNGAIYASSFFRTDSTAMFRDNRDNSIIVQSVNTLIVNRDLTIGNGTYRNLILSSTYVSIGTTTPSSKLHVKSAASATASTLLLQNSISTNTFNVLDNGEFKHLDTTGAFYSLSRPSASLNPRFHWNSGAGVGIFLDTLSDVNTFGFNGTVNFTRVTGISQDITNSPTLSLNSAWASAGFGVQATAVATGNLFNFYSYKDNTSTANALNVGNDTYANILTVKERGAVQIGINTVPLASLEVQDNFGLGLVADFRKASGVSVLTIDGASHIVNVYASSGEAVALSSSGVVRSRYFNLSVSGVPTTLVSGDFYSSGGKLYFYNGTTSKEIVFV